MGSPTALNQSSCVAGPGDKKEGKYKRERVVRDSPKSAPRVCGAGAWVRQSGAAHSLKADWELGDVVKYTSTLVLLVEVVVLAEVHVTIGTVRSSRHHICFLVL